MGIEVKFKIPRIDKQCECDDCKDAREISEAELNAAKWVRDEMLKRNAPYIERDKAVQELNKVIHKALNLKENEVCNLGTICVNALLSSGTFREPLTGWISVEKELPEVGEKVLVSNLIGGTAICYRGYSCDEIEWIFAYDGKEASFLGIKFWQPLPELPIMK